MYRKHTLPDGIYNRTNVRVDHAISMLPIVGMDESVGNLTKREVRLYRLRFEETAFFNQAAKANRPTNAGEFGSGTLLNSMM